MQLDRIERYGFNGLLLIISSCTDLPLNPRSTDRRGKDYITIKSCTSNRSYIYILPAINHKA